MFFVYCVQYKFGAPLTPLTFGPATREIRGDKLQLLGW